MVVIRYMTDLLIAILLIAILGWVAIPILGVIVLLALIGKALPPH